MKNVNYKQVIMIVLIALLSYFGGEYDTDPLEPPVNDASADLIAVLELNIDVLTEEKASLAQDLANQKVISTQLTGEVERLSTELAAALVVPTLPPPPLAPTPTDEPVYVAPFIFVKVTADKIVSLFSKNDNKAGYPIMLPEDSDVRLKFIHGEQVKVSPTLIRGDGSHFYYELYDHPGKYIAANKVVVLE